MRNYLLISFCFFVVVCSAQKKAWTKIIINPNLKIDTAFNKNWDYYWYMVKHEDGHFENTLSDSTTAEDTAHQFYTAACTNTHMGIQKINYCNAATYNDDVEMSFSGPSQGYNQALHIVIRKNHFSGSYNFQYIVLEKDREIDFEIILQKLVLKKKPVYGKMMTGTIEVRFREKIKVVRNKISGKPLLKPFITYSKVYVLRGRFHTPLDEVIDIE